MKLTRSHLILLAILFLGLFLRIYDLSGESIWFDEGYSIWVAKLTLVQTAVDATTQDMTPPLYYMILNLWVRLFGDSEFSVRFPSVIFGLFAILMIYKLASLMFNKEVGIISSFLLSISQFHIHYSQEARCYTLMALLALVSMYFFIKFQEKERSLTVSIGYGLSSILLIYTHVYGLLIIIAQNIYVFTLFVVSWEDYKCDFKRWVSLQLILFVSFVPWLGFLLAKVSETVEEGFYAKVPSILSIITSFVEYSFGSSLSWLLSLLLLLLSLASLERIKGGINWKDLLNSIENYTLKITLLDVKKIYLLLVWLFTPIILPFVFSQLSTPIYVTRHTIAASLAFYILVAKGIKNINSHFARLAIMTIIAVLSLRVLFGYYYPHIEKEQWREAAKYLDINAQAGDLLVFNCYLCQKWVFDYYSKKNDMRKMAFTKKLQPSYDDKSINVKELIPSVDGYSKIWYIQCLSEGYLDDKELIKKRLTEYYKLLDQKNFFAIEIYSFEKGELKKQVKKPGDTEGTASKEMAWYVPPHKKIGL